MKKIFSEIWKLAKPYYEKGRPMDIDHIEWMMQEALFVGEKENIDNSLLLPLVILHDIGYAEVKKDDPFKLDLRRSHMKKGAKIAREILEKINYPEDKTRKIEYYISVHDNWALGDNEIYKKDKILGIFTDLDYIWMATPKGFPALMNILNKNKEEMIKYLETNEKLTNRPFSSKTTENLYKKELNLRTSENIQEKI